MKASVSILRVLFVKDFNFFPMFIKERIEKDDSIKVLINSLNDNMSQILVLISKKP
jgi:hypothetical protein